VAGQIADTVPGAAEQTQRHDPQTPIDQQCQRDGNDAENDGPLIEGLQRMKRLDTADLRPVIVQPLLAREDRSFEIRSLGRMLSNDVALAVENAGVFPVRV
jgi:hypothetical protein